MTRPNVIFATLAFAGVLSSLVGLNIAGQTPARGFSERSTERLNSAESPALELEKLLYAPQAQSVWEGVMAPLNSLPVMQRAIAAAANPATTKVPTLAILNEPLKTTGLGPIRIGMSVDAVSETGLKLTPTQGSGRECRYYRIEDHVEPIGLMAVDNRILRIDVWPGSLTTALSGAKIGTTEQELVDYYGKDRLEATFNPNTEGKTIIFTPKDPGEDIFRLVFETDARGRVVQYRAGQFPSVTWPEGCL